MSITDMEAGLVRWLLAHAGHGCLDVKGTEQLSGPPRIDIRCACGRSIEGPSSHVYRCLRLAQQVKNPDALRMAANDTQDMITIFAPDPPKPKPEPPRAKRRLITLE